MVWSRILLILSMTFSDVPFKPMENDASFLLPSYLKINKVTAVIKLLEKREHVCTSSSLGINKNTSNPPRDGGEGTSVLGFKQHLVKWRVGSGYHQRGQKVQCEGLKRICDAGQRFQQCDQSLLITVMCKKV